MTSAVAAVAETVGAILIVGAGGAIASRYVAIGSAAVVGGAIATLRSRRGRGGWCGLLLRIGVLMRARQRIRPARLLRTGGHAWCRVWRRVWGRNGQLIDAPGLRLRRQA